MSLQNIFKTGFLILLAYTPLAWSQGSQKDVNRKGKVAYSTNLDFDSTMIDGKKKAPMGTMVKGLFKRFGHNFVMGLKRSFYIAFVNPCRRLLSQSSEVLSLSLSLSPFFVKIKGCQRRRRPGKDENK